MAQRCLALLIASTLAVLPAGCADLQTQHRDWSGYVGPGAEYFQVEDPPLPTFIDDPIQPFNRGLFAVNDWIMRWIVSPIGVGWRFVFPKPVRTHIGKAGKNLAFPTRALNDLFQGQPGEAGTEAARFLINTTVGLLGFFDPAASWGIEAPLAEDTGQTLQKAGWEDPSYLFLPLQGPSSTRDGVGLIGDTLTNIAWWLGGFVPAFFSLNGASDLVVKYEQLVATQPDPYKLGRLAWSVLRAAKVENRPTTPSVGVAGQTLMSVFMEPQDPLFIRTASTARVRIPSTGRWLPFNYWMADEPAPVLYVVPGLGSHRLSDHALALAESACMAGWSVVTITSTMHPEFMGAASTAPVPGYAPVDAHDVRVALTAIDAWLVERHGRRLQERAVAGLSLGAFHTLYIAAEQEREPDSGLLEFELFAAAAPPVSLEYGVGVLDGFYRAPMDWPEDERLDRITGTLKKVAALAGGKLRPGQPLPFSEQEAEYLIGLAFKLTLMDIIWDSQTRLPQGVLLTPLDPSDREAAYREIVEYSFMEYFYAFALPWLQREHGLRTGEEVFQQCDLRSISPWIQRSGRVRLYMSSNDFLRRPEDDSLLRALVAPKHLNVEMGGGHLGNGYKLEEREALMVGLRDELEAARR
jgi:phospholipid-binding lipoprotein MlaA